jgi:hypothetical protein
VPILRNKKTKEKMTTQCWETINRSIDTFAREFGDEVYDIILDSEKEYRKKYFNSHPDYQNLTNSEEDYKKSLQEFLWRGMGNPIEVEKKEKELFLRIDNPFSTPLLAAWIVALYEYLERIEAKIEYTSNLKAQEQGFANFKVSPI